MASENDLDSKIVTLPEGKLPETDFDPHSNRNVDLPTGYLLTLVNLTKGVIGTGLLTMPLAMHDAGIAGTAVLLIVMSSIVIYSMHRLLWVNYQICKYFKFGFIGYNQAFRISLAHGPSICKCLSKHSSKIITTFNAICQVGICIIYYLFSAEVLQTLVNEDYVPWNDIRTYLLLILLPTIVMTIVFRSMKLISFVSLMGNALVFAALIVSMIYCLMNITSEKIQKNNKQIGSFLKIMQAFGMSVFSLVSVGVVMAVEENCKNPHQYTMACGILNIGLIIPATLNFLVGLIGYLNFGNQVLPNYMRSIPAENRIGTASLVCFGISVFLSFPIHCFPLVDIFRKEFKPDMNQSRFTRDAIFKAGIVAISCVLASILPYLGALVSLVGALCMTSLGIVFPSLMELCIRWPDNYGRWNIHFYKSFLLFVFGLLCAIFGTAAAINDFVDKLS